MATEPPPAFFEALARMLPPATVTREPAELAEYGRDWTRVVEPAPCAVAFPRSTDEVAVVVRLCGEHGVAVVPSGGRTGLAGGAVAAKGELVLSLARMRAMHPVDAIGGTVRVQAGVVTQAVHEHCAPHGLTWPVDFASKGSSTVGGNIATNAGGVKVIRWGLTRQWVLGLQVVLASGEVLDGASALEKNNTGLDLRQLFIGTEGTLGVVTEATLKLARVPRRLDVLLFAVDNLPGVVRLFREVRASAFTLSAYEMFTAACLARVLAHRKLRDPLDAPASHYVLVEMEDAEEGALETWVQSLFERSLVRDGTLAQNGAEARALWALRESISESLSATGFPHKNDVALPIAALEVFCAALGELFARRYPGWEVCLFGHIGDGNLHVNVMKPADLEKPAFLAQVKDADRDLFDLVKAHGGSVSAEHGIGLLKKPWLAWTRSPGEIATMKAVKAALDPRGVLNPGKIFDPSGAPAS
ncbi:MAG TPA: FAD-binding oxidoreductase [Polyangiaceae bacterium]|nr:FAD-binding oxidoreductase [Polyangiaceae bacterium]